MNERTELTSHELAVLESLHDVSDAISQREIARRTGLSVGLINAVIKKLVYTGYVKTSQLNRRTISYLLTSEGFTQTAMKSYKYVLGTVRSYKNIQGKLEALLSDLKKQGVTKFYLNGDGELAELVSVFIKEDGAGELRYGVPENPDPNSIVLNALPNVLSLEKVKVVNLIDMLGSGKIGNRE